ncbi:MAG TPA: DNA primase [Atopostipes sp.]|nr:DNA primase [Atopostipes sp.]
MVRIPEATVDDIRQNTDIVDVVSQYLQLRKSGQNHFAHCPFHEDNTPSFSVNEQKQIFYCFSCGRGGNVFSFLKEIEGLSYPEAILKTAEFINYPLDQSLVTQVNSQRNYEDSTTGKLYSINQLAKGFYHHILMNTQIGKEALEYLLKRGMSRETIEEFELGFSPPQRNALFMYLSSHKEVEFDIETYQNSGLFSENPHPEQNEFLDRFSNRIIFPIHNERGSTIGFSGRIFEEKENSYPTAKYLNTPETTLFNKSKIIYNFDKAKAAIRRNNEAIFFEGYMDVISAWQAGVKNAVASMGTSLTEEQIKRIDRFTDHIVLAFDGDDAGSDAIKRSVDYLSEQTHFNLEVVTFPSGLDPDDYIQKHGKEQFSEFLTHGRDTHIGFLMQYHKRDRNLANESEQIQYIEEVLKELTKVDSLVEREIYLSQLSKEFDLSLDTLKSQFETIMDAVQTRQLNEMKRQQRKQRNEVPSLQVSYQDKPKMTLVEQAERMLLSRLFYHEEAWLTLNRIDSEFQFNDEDHQLIYILFESYREEDLDATDIEGFLDYLQEDKLRKKVAEIFLIDLGELKDGEIQDYIHVIKNVSPVKETIARKTEELREAQRQGNTSKQSSLAIEIINLNKKLKNKQ